MAISVNPATGELIKKYKDQSREEVFLVAKKAKQVFAKWGKMTVKGRVPYFYKLAAILRKQKQAYAKIITQEMGKPISQSLAEVEKCAWLADVYAEKAHSWLGNQHVEADGIDHYVAFEPLGVILSIMPWNFPFWQALRFAVPTIIAGNVSILKHASNVSGCSLAIEESFQEAGFPDNVFSSVITGHEPVNELIASDLIHGVSLTGSTRAGKKIAALAGQHLKKVVLELGGSDPFIVLEDSDCAIVVKHAVYARTQNTGQSCIAAKRFIVRQEIAEKFTRKLQEAFNKLKIGDPKDKSTAIGPMVNESALKEMNRLIIDAQNKGAEILSGAKEIKSEGYFFKPALLRGVSGDMDVLKEETFGPILPIYVVKTDEEAVRIANDSKFGLGASVWTRDLERGKKIAAQIEAGDVFVNSIVKSDPRMPFGGIKESGLGRELSHYGLKEFVNIKGYNIYEQK